MNNWWQERIIYQIYPRSFQDSNGDGIGDIPGIIQRLDQLQQLGIGIIWLSPVYCSPNNDFGYDISDYFNINPEYGSMADMHRLIQEAKKRDIRLVMDLVINHTSDQHRWFLESRDPESPYRDYYIWRKSKNGRPPNNWTSFFGEDCWVYDSRSDAWYLHLFSRSQPDLNYQNPRLILEIEAIMRYWLDLGIAGFRCDVINVLYKESLADGRKKMILRGSEHYLSRPGTHSVLQQLHRDVLRHYDCFTVGETVFITPAQARQFCQPEQRELDMIFTFEHMECDQILVKWFKRRFRPQKLARSICRWQNALHWNANYLENHDQPRSVSRFGNDQPGSPMWQMSAKMLATLLLTLRGTPFIYQGQEIGMTNFDYTSLVQIKDIESHNIARLARRLHFPAGLRWQMIRKTSRDNARTPMQWDSSTYAGFSSSPPWLAVNRNYPQINLASQLDDPDSIWSFYKILIRLRRQNPQLMSGTFTSLRISRFVFAYRRQLAEKRLVIILNFSRKAQKFPWPGQLLLSNCERIDYDGRLNPYEAVILCEEDEHE